MTANYDTWSEEEKRQAYFSLCAEVDRRRADWRKIYIAKGEAEAIAERERRHRKWALQEARIWMYGHRNTLAAAEAEVERERERADRAEADATQQRGLASATLEAAAARIEALEGCLRIYEPALELLSTECNGIAKKALREARALLIPAHLGAEAGGGRGERESLSVLRE